MYLFIIIYPIPYNIQPATMAELRPVETRESKDDGQVKVMGNGMTFAAGSPRTTWNVRVTNLSPRMLFFLLLFVISSV